MNKHEVDKAVDSEIEYQIKKHGAERQHRDDFAGWILLLDTQVDRIKEAWRTAHNDDSAKEELRKLLAIATVAARDHGIPARNA